MYFYHYERQTYEQQQIAAKVAAHLATVTVMQQPKHGILRLVTEADRGTLFKGTHGPMDPAAAAGFYAYLPEKGYLGKDKAVMLVDIGGVKVKVVYFFQGVEGPLGNTGVDDYCPKYQWKISTTLNPDDTNTLTTVEYQSPVVSAADQTATDAVVLASTLGLNFATEDNRGQTTFPANITPP